MAFTLRPETAETPEATVKADARDGSFQLSTQPVVSTPPAAAAGDDVSPTELPRSYGTRLLCLIPRDPRTIYVYWDIDWPEAFGGEPPSDRKVHLRVRSGVESEETTVAVEPMAGYCFVDVADGDAIYAAELGYYQPAGTWHSIARSESVTTPPDATTVGAADYATVPFHLSFERMLDELRIAKQESAALTAMLNDLRQRAASAADRATLTAGQQEIATAIDQAAPPAPTERPTAPQTAQPRDLWTSPAMRSASGFGATSPRGGFGGSSRA
jgi:hypothetical protein